MTRTVAACPECDCASIVRQSTTPRGDGAYRCPACNHLFDEPIERESQSPTDSLTGLPKRLHDADPDEVSR